MIYEIKVRVKEFVSGRKARAAFQRAQICNNLECRAKHKKKHVNVPFVQEIIRLIIAKNS